MKQVFLNTDEFADEIEYASSGVLPKEIKAIVVFKELELTGENNGRAIKNQAEIYILKDEDDGVLQINKQNDRITFNDSEGIERRGRIVDIITQDEGMFHLLVGW
ncbi:hypothetical protein M0R36_04240 [bacterium]|nr:hypothetical protein [bacterium]